MEFVHFFVCIFFITLENSRFESGKMKNPIFHFFQVRKSKF